MSAIDPAGLPAPLVGEAKRQAMDSILGYDYQIWRTVEAWMLLNSGETLYIECAEDFDVIDSSGASMVQLKNSPSAITINSGDVKNAIQNFWTAKTKNANRGKIGLRFLTRGEIGHERERPFGDERGLELWKLAAAGDEAAAKRLASHLSSTLGNASLVAFLKTAKNSELIEKLFNCIEWVTGESSIEAVRLAVRRMAIQRGAHQKVTAQASADAVDALLAKCREIAVRKEPELRSLTPEDLQLVFERSTSLPVPITGDFLAALSSMLSPKATGPSFALSLVRGELPMLPQPHLPRSEFAQTIASSLIEWPVVLIVGSEGRGKTTAANIVGQKVTGAVHWVDLSTHSDDRAVAMTIEGTLLKVRGPERPRCVILDDVPVAQGMSDQVWIPLRALMESCSQFKTVLLLTAKGVVEDAVDSKFRTARAKVLPVPGLSQPEVEQFFLELGCPPERLSDWAKLTLLQSGNGHPKLVYLRGLELQDSGWPPVTSDAVVAAPKSIEEARANARQVAAKVVGDVDRPFLYTLSLSAIPFDRAVALSVGSRLSIEAPGESFDRLAGRWIESRGRIGYSVTTMLNGQAQKIWAEEKLCEAHQVLFDAFINRRSIRVDEAWGVFLHAFAGKEPGRLGNFLATLLGENLETTDGLAEALDVLLLIGSEASTFAVPFDRRCSIMLRIVQFRIAKIRRVETLSDIVEKWAWEIAQISDSKEKEAAKVIRGLSIACTMEGELSPSIVVNAVRDAAGFEKFGLSLGAPDFLGAELRAAQNINVTVLAWLFAVAQTRCKNADQLDQFLEALDALDTDIRSQMLQAFELPYVQMSLSMVERVWLGETKKEHKDWPTVISVLERSESFANKWDCSAFSIAVTKTLSLIYDEELKDSAKSLEVLRAAKAHVSSILLKEQEANVLFRGGDFEAALRLWREVLYDGGGGSEYSEKRRDRFAMRKAGIAAAKLGFFDEAAVWMQGAAVEATRDPMGVPAAAFYLDASYCWFKHGNGEKTVAALTTAALTLKGNYDPESEFFAFAAQKNAGNTALWLLDQFRNSEGGGTEPFVGSSSNPDLNREGYQSLPASPYAVTAWMILEIANRIGVNFCALGELSEDLENTRNALAGMQFRVLKLRKTIELGKLNDMAACINDLQIAMWKSKETMKVESGIMTEFSTNVEDELRSDAFAETQWIFMIGLVLRTIVKGSPEKLANEWEIRLRGLPYDEEFQVVVTSSLRNFDLDLATASSKMRVSPPSPVNIGAAARLLANDRRSPIDTAYAQIALLVWFQSSPARMFLNSSLEQFFAAFADHWRQLISTPALLVNPRMTVPMIEQAINSKGPIAERLLQLLLGASSASRMSLPQVLIDKLANLSKEQKVLDSFRREVTCATASEMIAVKTGND